MQNSRRERIRKRNDTDVGESVPKIRGAMAANRDDYRVSKLAQHKPTVLHSWLIRVDDRFFGSPVDIHPHDAILKAIRITAGEVDYCDRQIAQLTEDELFERPLKTKLAEGLDGSWQLVEETRDAEVLSRWVAFRQHSVERLARYAKMALDIGIEERQIQLAEREADMINGYFEAVLQDVELTPAQRRKLGPSMRKHLELIEGQETNTRREIA